MYSMSIIANPYYMSRDPVDNVNMLEFYKKYMRNIFNPRNILVFILVFVPIFTNLKNWIKIVDPRFCINKIGTFVLTFLLILSFVYTPSGLNPIYEIPEADAAYKKVTFLTNGTTSWTVPSDWNNQANMVEVIGGGGGGTDGANNDGSGGSGGGGYAKSSNIKLTRGAVLNVNTNFVIGAAGTVGGSGQRGGNGGHTWFNSDSYANCAAAGDTVCVSAEGGESGINVSPFTGGAGGGTASASGQVKYAGGDGGAGVTTDAGGAGGGAGGPYGDGKNGGAGVATEGGGGGGGGGGTIGLTGSGVGGNGGNNYLGVGGGTGGNGADNATAGTNGGGGGGGDNTHPGKIGGAGIEWDSTHGSSGGGGGGGQADFGGSGGNYGGGAGAGEVNSTSTIIGGQGLIVISYIPPGHVIRGGVRIRGFVKFR